MNPSDTHSPPPVALSALILLAHYHGISANPADILHRYAAAGDLSQTEWLLAAKDLGLKAKPVSHDVSRLHLLALPALVWREDGRHFVLAKIDGERYLIQDLAAGRPDDVTPTLPATTDPLYESHSRPLHRFEVPGEN